jgi:hypothetical protein
MHIFKRVVRWKQQICESASLTSSQAACAPAQSAKSSSCLRPLPTTHSVSTTQLAHGDPKPAPVMIASPSAVAPRGVRAADHYRLGLISPRLSLYANCFGSGEHRPHTFLPALKGTEEFHTPQHSLKAPTELLPYLCRLNAGKNIGKPGPFVYSIVRGRSCHCSTPLTVRMSFYLSVVDSSLDT